MWWRKASVGNATSGVGKIQEIGCLGITETILFDTNDDHENHCQSAALHMTMW